MVFLVEKLIKWCVIWERYMLISLPCLCIYVPMYGVRAGVHKLLLYIVTFTNISCASASNLAFWSTSIQEALQTSYMYVIGWSFYGMLMCIHACRLTCACVCVSMHGLSACMHKFMPCREHVHICVSCRYGSCFFSYFGSKIFSRSHAKFSLMHLLTHCQNKGPAGTLFCISDKVL